MSRSLLIHIMLFLNDLIKISGPSVCPVTTSSAIQSIANQFVGCSIPSLGCRTSLKAFNEQASRDGNRATMMRVWVVRTYRRNIGEAELNHHRQSSLMASASRHGKRAAWILAALTILAAALASHAASRTARQPFGGGAQVEKSARAPVKAYGSPSAPITMEVFTDYECPTCRSFYEQTLRPLINDYVATGKVYVIHHDFPLSVHKYSGQAARWANAAAEVGQFDGVEAALYDNQSSWETDGSVEKYISAALPPAAFKRVQERMRGCDAPGPRPQPRRPIPARWMRISSRISRSATRCR